MEITPQLLGSSAERSVGTHLMHYGRVIKMMPHGHPFDILVDGVIRLEVKAARPRMTASGPKWMINFHRHGVLNESNTDGYVIRLDEVPFFKASIYLFYDAPMKVKTLRISLRSLLMQHGDAVKAFERFRGNQVKYGRKPRLEAV